MWGQAERLARMSDQKRLAKPDGETAYAGSVKYGKQAIGWTIWHGTGSGATYDRVMAGHEKTDAFKSARIRIATLDKAHWSLLRSHENKKFAKRLNCFVLDEAHSYDGVFGANVHYFLKRLYMASEILGPATAGLVSRVGDPQFRTQVRGHPLSLEHETDIVHIEDSTKQQIDLIPTRTCRST